MNQNDIVLKNEEKIIFLLRALYAGFGYRQYKMSKFEEYDLYARNKDFLISDNIITFTDTNGKLMALKPDVTLSIVRATREQAGTVSRVFYDENVYRVSKGSHAYKEILQTGIECIGDIDAYCVSEVLYLAAKSLQTISGHYLLNISHLGIVSGLLDELCLSADARREAVRLIGEKNLHELTALLEKAGTFGENERATESVKAKSPDGINLTPGGKLLRILDTTGTPAEVLGMLRECGCDEHSVRELEDLTALLESTDAAEHLVIDFSVINDMNYYNGIVFKGYIEGVPTGILSGGQYDRLLRKMGKRAGAIGFAVYMDFLERFLERDEDHDVDIVLLYGEETEGQLLFSAVRQLTGEGYSVSAQKTLPDKLRYSRVMRLNREGVLETVNV